MAESTCNGLGDRVDIGKIIEEAQHRWLRPAEICEIIRNYEKFRIAPEPANMPISGSLFLFDRKVLRYFRKDGHNWRKKNDGNRVKEAHERLKVGSIDVLHCYYAYGEENENFQRRSYWMLEEELSHIVLVHYREVKLDQANRTNVNRIGETEEAFPYSHETEDILPNSEIYSSIPSSFLPNYSQVPSQTTDTTSLNSAQASEYEDAELAYNHQARIAFHSFREPQQPMVEKINAGLTDPHFPASVSRNSSAISGVDFVSPIQADEEKDLDFLSLEVVSKNGTYGSQNVPLQPSFLEGQPDTIGVLGKRENQIPGQAFTSNLGERQEFGGHPQIQEEWQIPTTNDMSRDISNIAAQLLIDLEEDNDDENVIIGSPIGTSSSPQLVIDLEKDNDDENVIIGSPIGTSSSPQLVIDLEEDNDDENVIIGSERPLGKKAAKERERKRKSKNCGEKETVMEVLTRLMKVKKRSYEERKENIDTVKEEIICIEKRKLEVEFKKEEIEKQKLEIELRKEEREIMLMDTTNLTPIQLEYIQSRQKEIIHKHKTN